MAGSPVFKIKPSSCKKPKLQRKMLPNRNDDSSKHLQPLHAKESLSDSLDQCLEIKDGSCGTQDVTNRNGPNQSICSSLSSFVFPSKKCAKRKLNFDVDGDNDDVSSLRFSDKNLSLCGLRSKSSSVADRRSLPDIRNAVQSPNKNRTRFSGSYRSSVGSTISCRRKLLFTEFEESVKRPRLTSPVLCQKTKSNKKEIKLSLKKKFPGVPNSDFARSGLLLNLAFSKYNLSSSKKEDVSVDFVDNASCTATKKDFVHYSQIKQDESSRCRSPVFMAIKKVKRKLNLEDQSTNVSNKSMENDYDNLKIDAAKDEIPTCEPIHEKQNPLKTDTSCEPPNSFELDNNNDSLEPNPKWKSHVPPTTQTESIREILNFNRQETSAKISSPFSPVIIKQSNMSGNHSLTTEKLKVAKCKNNLFKNSKIRSTLRDKIFDLSKVNSTCDRKVSNNVGNKSVFNADNCRKTFFETNDSGNNCRSSLLMKENSSRNATTGSKKAKLIKDYPSSNIVCKTKNLQHSKNAKKWIDRDSFARNSSANHQLKIINSSSCDQKFLKSHMNRFLTDCLEFAVQKSDSGVGNFPLDITSENEIVDDDKDDNPNEERIDLTIENVDSQKTMENTNRRAKKIKNGLLDDNEDANITTVDGEIETNDCQRKVKKSSFDEVKIMENVFVDRTNFDDRNNEEIIGSCDFPKKFCEINNEVEIGENKLITDEKSRANEQSCITIEDVNSQDTVVIENVDSQCEQVVIEPIESQNEIKNLVADPLETDVNLLLLESQNFSMSIPLKNCIPKKSTKACKSVDTNTNGITSPVFNTTAVSKTDCRSSRKTALESTMDVSVFDSYEQIEQISTSASYSCVQFTDKNEESLTFNHENMSADMSGLFETTKKTKKKSFPNSLTQRLDKLLNRDKSDFRMWEYEMSKTNVESISNRKPAVFCIEKMWKEYSHLILLCYYFHRNVSVEKNVKFNELESFSKDVSNSVVIILEQEWCPKNLTYSTVFRIDPPWKFLNFGKCAPLFMLKPHKISVISTEENPVLYKDPTIPNTFIVTKQRELCSCGDNICNCGVPNCYQFLIEPLLLPNLTSFSQKFSYHHFDADTFNCRRINDVLIKHKLFATEDLSLNVQVLHSHKDESMCEFSFWYFVCLDEQKNICCVLAESETDNVLPYVNKEIMLKFTGISPFKMIPSKNVMIFLQYLNFTVVPDVIKNTIDSQSIIVFVLSDEHGNVECVD